MTRLKIAPAEAPEQLPPEMPEQLEQQEQLPPEITAELMPDDGQPTTPEMLQPDESADFSPVGLTTTTTNNYTRDEFRQKFAAVLEFLENPATANNCVTEIVTNGRNLTADKIYNLASRYKWLSWIIDSRTQIFADSLQIAAFLAVESNVIVMNWTGLNMFERLKIWLKNKAEQRKAAQKSGKRRSLFGWVFSGRAEAEKLTEQNSSQKV